MSDSPSPVGQVATPPAPPPAARTLRQHIMLTIALAWPVVIARAGLLVLTAVDIAMTGHAGQDQLAFISIGMAPQITLMLVGIGMLYGTTVLTAQAHGAGDHAACGGIWRLAMIHALGLGIIIGGLCFAGEWFFLIIGQDPAVAAGGGGVLRQFSWGMPGMMMAVCTSFFLEGISRPRAGMIVMVIANVANAGLNWVFIYGNLGAPAMGAEGAVIASSIVRWLIMAALIAYAFAMTDSGVYGVRQGRAAGREVGRKLRRIGYPFGLAQGIEASAFSGLVLMAGYIGTAALGGYQIAQNLIALAFMCAIGIGVATAVRVGNAVGRKDRPGMAAAGWTGVGLSALVMAGIAVLFLGWPGMLARIYSSDTAVLAVAAPTIAVAGIVLVFDGVQGVLMGALRGAGQVWMPVFMHMTSFYVFGLPIAALFAFTFGFDAPGLMLGMFFGVTCAAILMGWRFHVISKRDISRL